jgi:uncharacterized protein (DUF433 family)
VSRLDDAKKLVAALTGPEKAELFRRIVDDVEVGSFPGIDITAEVCGGAPCIVRARIPVWLIEQARRSGASDADLLRAYPSLREEDLLNAQTFVQGHRDLVDQAISENEAA